MTDGPILLTGLDFSYIPGKTHSRGAPAHALDLIGRTRLSGIRMTPRMFDGHSMKTKAPISVPHALRTNPVLDWYARNLAQIIEGRSNVFDTNRNSILEGVHRVDSAEIARILEEDRVANGEADRRRRDRAGDERGRKDGGGEEEAEDRTETEVITSLLHRENDLLEEALRRFRSILLDRDPVTESDERLLEETDYLYADFPDMAGKPLEDQGFLRRLIVSAEYYREVLSKAQEIEK